jgi:glycosyltransferase involved in cell wall biosynthesis
MMPRPRPLVLLVAPTFGAFGGMERFVWDVASAIAATGDLDARICLKRTRPFDERPELRRRLADAPVGTVVVGRGSGALLREVARADLVHAQTLSPDVALAAALLRRPLALSFHNPRRGDEGWRGLLGRWAARRAVARWYNSDFVWGTWEPSAPAPGSERLPVASIIEREPVPPAERRGFLFAGRWVAGKGVDVLVEAYARARLDRERWPLVLLGDGPERPAIERRIAEHGLTTVELAGFVDGDARDARIRAAKWLVAPPHWNEPLGLTPLEARSVGVPCIVTHDGGLPEAAGPFSLVCAPGSVDHLRRALEFVAAMDEREYARFARATRDLLLAERRGLDAYAERYRAILGRT